MPLTKNIELELLHETAFRSKYFFQKQIKQLNLQNESDIVIWEFAKLHNFTIVTFDSDFADIALLKGFPPKIIWLRTGNTTTDNLADLISANRKSIIEFLSSIDEAVLILN